MHFPAIEPIIPEFRLYYDENGSVICYTCDDLPGNYLTVDSTTFIEARYDVKVIDGELVRNYHQLYVSKLVPTTEQENSTKCSKTDISIIADENIESQNWRVKTSVY